MNWQAFIDGLPPTTRAAVEQEAACRGITALKLATELMERYANDPDCKCRLDCVTTKILEAAIKKQPYTHLVPRDMDDAITIQLVMEVERNKLWPGVGKVIARAIEMPD
jgi:hypothetical protein